MKEKKLTITSKDITQKQWSNLILELNLIKKSWERYAKIAHEPIFHKTSIGRNPSKCKMNKQKRRSYKKYRGQG